MFVSNTISSRLLVYVHVCAAAVLLLLIVFSTWYFPNIEGTIEFLANALVCVLTWIFVSFLIMKLTSLRVITKRGSHFLVRGFRYTAEYEDQTLTAVRLFPQRGHTWVQFVFDTGGTEQIENTISQFDFVSNSDKFGIDSNLVKKMPWFSFANKAKVNKAE